MSLSHLDRRQMARNILVQYSKQYAGPSHIRRLLARQGSAWIKLGNKRLVDRLAAVHDMKNSPLRRGST